MSRVALMAVGFLLATTSAHAGTGYCAGKEIDLPAATAIVAGTSNVGGVFIQPPLGGSIATAVPAQISGVTKHLLWADFDGDDLDELAAVTYIYNADGVPSRSRLSVFDGDLEIHLGTFTGAIKAIAAGDFDGDGDKDLAVVRRSTLDAPWSARVYNVIIDTPPLGGSSILREVDLGVSEPEAVAIGDLYLDAAGPELLVGVGNRIEAFSSSSSAALPDILLGGFGIVTALDFGEYDGVDSLAVARRITTFQPDSDADWKAATIAASSGQPTVGYIYGSRWVGNIMGSDLNHLEWNQQAVAIKLSDLNADGSNELVLATYGAPGQNTELANANTFSWVLIYSERLPHVVDDPSTTFDDQHLGEVARYRFVTRITGLAISRSAPEADTPDIILSVARNQLQATPSQWTVGILTNVDLSCALETPFVTYCPFGITPLRTGTAEFPAPDETYDLFLPFIGDAAVAATSRAAVSGGQWANSICSFNDNQCDGIDQDGDGVPDDDFPRSSEILNGIDDDCNYQIDDIGTFPTCAPGDQSWQCCPTGELTFQVDRRTDDFDETTAASHCLPIGVGETGNCTLRGVVRLADQLRNQPCAVVAQLSEGEHTLSLRSAGPDGDAGSSHLRLVAGDLTVRGPAAAAPRATIRANAQGGTHRHFWLGLTGPVLPSELPPKLTLANVIFLDGNTDDFNQFGGGAIGTKTTGAVVRIDDSVFQNNTATQQGGAVQVWHGSLAVRNTLFRHNSTQNAAQNSRGGAISVFNSAFYLADSALVANYGDSGGAVSVHTDSTATIVNTTISGNQCENFGCGLESIASDLRLRFSTIADNGNAGNVNGSGIYSNGFLQAFGNIIAQNFPRTLPACDIDVTVAGAVVAAFNLIDAGGGPCDVLGDPMTDPLIGQGLTDVVNARLASLPSVPEDSMNSATWLCPPGRLGGQACQIACIRASTAAECGHDLGMMSAALAAYNSGASDSGAPGAQDDAPHTCPLMDQRHNLRPTVGNCSLGAYEPVATAQRFNAIGGSNVSDVPDAPAPDQTYRLDRIETPSNIGDNYGIRVAGLIEAPSTGSYTFWVAGDDNVALYLSPSWDASAKSRIAYHTSYTGYREWNKFPTQRSAPISLVAGERYYIEAVMKEASGADSLSVGWRKPGQAGSTPSEIVPLAFPAPFVPRGEGYIEFEKWTNIGGTGVSTIPTGTAPNFVESRTRFEGLVNITNNYGARLRGWLTAPTSGAYRFWISGDDNVALYFSLSGGPEAKMLIAHHNGYANQYEWNKYATQQSQDIQLVAGQRYYIEALLKEASGNDHVEVGWRLPGQTGNVPSEVIPGRQLSPFVSSTAPVVLTGRFQMRNTNSNLCVDVRHAMQTDGTRIQQFFCNGTPAQQFDFADLGSGILKITNRQSQKCLHPVGSAAGSNVELRTCQPIDHDRWLLFEAGSGRYTVRNAASGRCLDVEGDNLASESNMEVRDCNGTASQRFQLSQVAGYQAEVQRGAEYETEAGGCSMGKVAVSSKAPVVLGFSVLGLCALRRRRRATL